MAKEFILAEIRSHHTAWNVQLSNETEPERFVAKAGAIGYVQSVSSATPVQLLVYLPNSDRLAEAFFIENKVMRKLNVLVVASDTKRGNW